MLFQPFLHILYAYMVTFYLFVWIWQPYSVRMRKLADETHVSSKQRCDI